MSVTTEKLIEMYKAGLSSIKIGKMVGLSPSTVQKRLKKSGVKMRSNKINSKKFFLNDSYFHDIDSEEKAYWFGFLYADGYITKNYIGLSLCESDAGHIEKFRNAIQDNHPIHHYMASGYSEVPYSRLLFTSDEMVGDLISHGLIRNKTNIIEPPIGIPQELIKHFIRGYIDGDGSIYKNGNSWALSAVATPSLLMWMVEYFETNLGITYRSIRKRHDYDIVQDFRYYGKNAYKICYHLYEDATIYLDRKYERYLLMKEVQCRLQ